jgi:hypothetical protein
MVHGCDGQTGHLINMATVTKRKRPESKTLGLWKKPKGEESTESHPSGQLLANAAAGKRNRHEDMHGEYAGPAVKRQNTQHVPGKNDTCHTTERQPSGQVLAHVKDRDVHWENEHGVDDGLCDDIHGVTVCATIFEVQKRCGVRKEHIPPSATLDADFLRRLDPSLRVA